MKTLFNLTTRSIEFNTRARSTLNPYQCHNKLLIMIPIPFFSSPYCLSEEDGNTRARVVTTMGLKWSREKFIFQKKKWKKSCANWPSSYRRGTNWYVRVPQPWAARANDVSTATNSISDPSHNPRRTRSTNQSNPPNRSTLILESLLCLQGRKIKKFTKFKDNWEMAWRRGLYLLSNYSALPSHPSLSL